MGKKKYKFYYDQEIKLIDIIQKRLVTEDCYPYESGESGIASECKLNFHNTFYNNRMLCPSDGKPSKNVLLSSSTPYQLSVESSVNIRI